VAALDRAIGKVKIGGWFETWLMPELDLECRHWLRARFGVIERRGAESAEFAEEENQISELVIGAAILKTLSLSN